MKSMSGSDFVKSMLRSEEKKNDDLFVVGMAKVAPDDRDSIMLGPTHKCGPWTKVPLSAILRVVPLAHCPCKQHEHPVVAVYFKDKDDPVAVVLGRLLRDMQKDMYSQMMRTSGGGRSSPAGLIVASVRERVVSMIGEMVWDVLSSGNCFAGSAISPMTILIPRQILMTSTVFGYLWSFCVRRRDRGPASVF